MFDKIWEVITANVPAWVVILLLILILVAVATWKVKTLWDRFTSIERKVNDHETLGRSLLRIDRQLAVLLSHFIAKKEIDAALLQTESPLRVTALGNDLLAQSGFTAAFPSIRSKVVEHVGSLNPHTKLDLENASIQAIFVLLGEPEMTPFKNWLYEHPQYKATENVTVTTNELLTTAGVYVRDRLLEDGDLMRQWNIT